VAFRTLGRAANVASVSQIIGFSRPLRRLTLASGLRVQARNRLPSRGQCWYSESPENLQDLVQDDLAKDFTAPLGAA